MNFTELEKRIKSFSYFDYDWDSYGAPMIDHRAIKAAIFSVCNDSSGIVPHPVPTVSGGVQLEWHEGTIDIEAEFFPNGDVEIYVENDNNEFEKELNRLRMIEKWCSKNFKTIYEQDFVGIKNDEILILKNLLNEKKK